jgi:hypothetical protein
MAVLANPYSKRLLAYCPAGYRRGPVYQKASNGAFTVALWIGPRPAAAPIVPAVQPPPPVP